MKVLIAEFNHESNTFCPKMTTKKDFQDRYLISGHENIISTFENTKTVLGGFIDEIKRNDISFVGSIAAAAAPYGAVTKDVFDYVFSVIKSDIQNNDPLDGILLSLHGAMVSEKNRSADCRFLELIREISGWDIPIVIVLDLHANLDPKISHLVNGAISCKTYPHIDFYETGIIAASIILKILKDNINTSTICTKIPATLALTAQRTDLPENKLIDSIRNDIIAKNRDILDISVLYGFYFSDTENLGMSILCTSKNEPNNSLFEDIQYLKNQIENLLGQVKQNIYTCNEAITETNRLINLNRKVLLADISDNPGAGALGNNLSLLSEILNHNICKVLISGLFYPEVVSRAKNIEIGGKHSIKLEDDSGNSVNINSTILKKSDGHYILSGPYDKGGKANYGESILVQAYGVSLLIHSVRHQCLDPSMITSIGATLDDYSIIILKSSVHFRAAFTDLVDDILEVDTNGIISPDPRKLNYRYANIKKVFG